MAPTVKMLPGWYAKVLTHTGYGIVLGYFCFSVFFYEIIHAQEADLKQTLDQKVEAFLQSRRGKWRDMNVLEPDGKLLYDLIIKNNYKSALEIGTSTGHSSLWIAWALSKTGGQLITIEIDKERYREAVANFTAAGLSTIIDAPLGDLFNTFRRRKLSRGELGVLSSVNQKLWLQYKELDEFLTNTVYNK